MSFFFKSSRDGKAKAKTKAVSQKGEEAKAKRYKPWLVRDQLLGPPGNDAGLALLVYFFAHCLIEAS